MAGSCLVNEATEKLIETPTIIHNLIEARKVYKEVAPINMDEVETIINHRNAKKLDVPFF